MIEATTMAWTGGGIQPSEPSLEGDMIDIKNTGNEAPAAGGTCSTPVGPAHPCAADCAHEACHAGWFARKARADGLVYCCSFEGWVTPAEAYEHSAGAYSSYRDDD